MPLLQVHTQAVAEEAIDPLVTPVNMLSRLTVIAGQVPQNAP